MACKASFLKKQSAGILFYAIRQHMRWMYPEKGRHCRHKGSKIARHHGNTPCHAIGNKVKPCRISVHFPICHARRNAIDIVKAVFSHSANANAAASTFSRRTTATRKNAPQSAMIAGRIFSTRADTSIRSPPWGHSKVRPARSRRRCGLRRLHNPT